MAETTDTAVDPEVDAPSEYTTESAPARPTCRPRSVNIAAAGATGRRKEAVARVRIVPGTGTWTVNGRTLEEYFPNKLHQQLVNEPFVLTSLVGQYDVIARIHGGGLSGQAGALRLGVPAPQRDRRRGQPPDPQEGRHADPRRADQGAQEGRAQEGPQGSAVQQALSRGVHVARLFGTDGVRGVANGELTAELALDLAVAAAHVLGSPVVAIEHAPAAGRRRPRPSGLRRVPRGGRGGRSGLGRRRRPPARRTAHARRSPS